MKYILAFFVLGNFNLFFAENEKINLFRTYYDKPLLARLLKSDMHIGILAEDENSELSWKGYLSYIKMQYDCLKNIAEFVDIDKNNNRTLYVCSSDKLVTLVMINRAKNYYLRGMRNLGDLLKEGALVHYTALDIGNYKTLDDRSNIIVVVMDQNCNCHMDSENLGLAVHKILKENNYGVHILEECQCPIKISLVKPQDFINGNFDFFPTHDEIQKAKSIISDEK